MGDEDDKGRKQNTDKDFKPKHGNRDGHAPRGAVGRPAAGMAGPGLAASSSRQERFRQAQEQVKSQGVARDEDGRIKFRHSEPKKVDPAKPYAIETGDPNQDKELAKDHNVISREQAEEMMGKENVAKAFYDEPSKGANQDHAKEMVPKEAEKLLDTDPPSAAENGKSGDASKGGVSADDIFKKMPDARREQAEKIAAKMQAAKQKDQGKDHGRDFGR
jgi:hypothetical protein